MQGLLVACFLLLIPFPVGAVSWPLRISSSGRYLEDQAGVPFQLIIDAGWELTTQISDAQAITYLDNRLAKGFNAIEVRVIGHTYQSNAPNDYYDNAPFTNGHADWSVRNETYWNRIDAIVGAAKARGMVIVMFPAYLGNGCYWDGWCADMTSQNDAAMTSYGTWIGARYAAYGNIIWMRGGDTDCASTTNACARDTAVVNGVKAGFSGALFSVEPGQDQLGGVDSYATGTEINGVYNLGATQSHVERAYDIDSKPFILQEANYENEHGTTIVVQDAQMMISLLGGALAGSTFGSCPLWSFGNTTSFCDSLSSPFNTWTANMDSPASVSAGNIGKLMRSRRWWGMVPDYANAVVTSSKGSELSYKATARETNGKTVMVWNPTTAQITVDMTKISGSNAKAWWWNPDDNSATSPGTYATTGTRNFSPGSARLVLVLDNDALGYAAPGTTNYSEAVATLSNTPVTQSQRVTFFPYDASSFVADADGNASGIHVNTTVWAGRTGSAAEGLFLYDYLIEGNLQLRWLRVPFGPPLAFDIDANAGADSSAYCSTCSIAPPPTPPTVAVEIGDDVYFNFDSGIAGASNHLYLFSDRAPRSVMGEIMLQDVGTAGLQVLPDPDTSLGALTTGTALMLLAWRARRMARDQDHVVRVPAQLG